MKYINNKTILTRWTFFYEGWWLSSSYKLHISDLWRNIWILTYWTKFSSSYCGSHNIKIICYIVSKSGIIDENIKSSVFSFQEPCKGFNAARIIDIKRMELGLETLAFQLLHCLGSSLNTSSSQVNNIGCVQRLAEGSDGGETNAFVGTSYLQNQSINVRN